MRDPDALPAWAARQLGRVRDRRSDDKIVRWFYRRAMRGQGVRGPSPEAVADPSGGVDTALLHAGAPLHIH